MASTGGPPRSVARLCPLSAVEQDKPTPGSAATRVRAELLPSLATGRCQAPTELMTQHPGRSGDRRHHVHAKAAEAAGVPLDRLVFVVAGPTRGRVVFLRAADLAGLPAMGPVVRGARARRHLIDEVRPSICTLLSIGSDPAAALGIPSRRLAAADAHRGLRSPRPGKQLIEPAIATIVDRSAPIPDALALSTRSAGTHQARLWVYSGDAGAPIPPSRRRRGHRADQPPHATRAPTKRRRPSRLHSPVRPHASPSGDNHGPGARRPRALSARRARHDRRGAEQDPLGGVMLPAGACHWCSHTGSRG